MGVAIVGLGLVWVWTNVMSKEIHANKFILKDAAGKTRAALFMNEYGPSLNLLDENGRERASLYVDMNMSRLGLLDEKGNLLAELP